MKPVIIKPKNRAEWLKAREDGIGASEVAAVLGLSPWETPFSLWLRKTGQVPPLEENQAMKLGHLLEPVVVSLWEEATGWRAVKASAKDIIYQDPEHPWRKVTPDRIAYEIDENGKKGKCLLEIKSSQKDFEPDDLPVYYICQCQYQMHVTGIHACYLCWLVRGLNFGYARIEYDKEFAEFLVSKVDAFYQENVKGNKEPELISVDDFAYKGSDPGTTIEADEEAYAQLLSLRTLNKDLNTKEADAEALKDSIKLYMGQNESLSFDGKVLATWKTGARGRTFRLKDKLIDELLEQKENGN